MSERPVVLVFNRYYLPGYRAGGPIRTLVNLVSRLGHEFDFRIVTLDRDLGDERRYPGVVAERWERVGDANVLYGESEFYSLGRLRQLVSSLKPNVVYLNSFFDPLFTLRILILNRLGLLGSAKVLLAPRGEFSEAALNIKRLKKRMFLACAKVIGLYKNVYFQASSDEERAALGGRLGFAAWERTTVAMNLANRATSNDSARAPRRHGDPLRLCFLGRIAPMKNLDFALRVLNRVSQAVDFRIYGPIESDEYWRKCEALIEGLPSHIRVFYEGELKHTLVEEALGKNDLFFLPTLGENYGHVIVEALSAGLPVLISDRTPWGEIEKKGVGWCLSLDDLDGFARVIEKVGGWSEREHCDVRIKAREFAVATMDYEGTLEANRRLFAQ